jgi:hypothetical protein
MRIKNFKLFEDKQGFIDDDYIKDIFIDLIDNNFQYVSYDNYNVIGKYFFEFKKYFTENELGYVDNNHVYGYSNLDEIKEEINSSIEIIKESRERLSEMGYTLAFELEFNFSTTAMISIVCHMHHKKYDGIDE